MLVIPTQAVANQTLEVSLDGQACSITIWSKSTGMFLDLYVNDVLIQGGMLCRQAVRLVRDSYIGFIGDLCWFDTQTPPADPEYTDIGPNGRWFLAYLETSDITGDV